MLRYASCTTRVGYSALQRSAAVSSLPFQTAVRTKSSFDDESRFDDNDQHGGDETYSGFDAAKRNRSARTRRDDSTMNGPPRPHQPSFQQRSPIAGNTNHFRPLDRPPQPNYLDSRRPPVPQHLHQQQHPQQQRQQQQHQQQQQYRNGQARERHVNTNQHPQELPKAAWRQNAGQTPPRGNTNHSQKSFRPKPIFNEQIARTRDDGDVGTTERHSRQLQQGRNATAGTNTGQPGSPPIPSWRLNLQTQRDNAGGVSFMERLVKSQQSQRDAQGPLSDATSNGVPPVSSMGSLGAKAVSERLDSSWKPRLVSLQERQEKQGAATDSLLSRFQNGSEVPSKEIFSRESMTDVSNLRDAFIKGVESEKVRIRQQAEDKRAADARGEQDESFSVMYNQTQSWRAPNGAKECREKLDAEKEMEREAQLHRPERGPDLGAVNLSNRLVDAANKKKRDEMKKRREQGLTGGKNASNEILLPPDDISVLDVALKMRVGQDMIMSILRELGDTPISGSSMVDVDTMELVAMELGLEPIRSKRRVTKSISEEDREVLLKRRAAGDNVDEALLAQYEALPQRPPVVCLMGHVDHGKTTLMDALRRRSFNSGSHQSAKARSKKARTANKNATADDVAGTEAGGITQAITAFQVMLEEKGTAVTFLDTPGHAAFRAMRESGSHAADVIVLVIAADDGVSQQTIEILNFFKSIVTGSGGSGISLVVAMTKIDKPGIDVDSSQRRIENQLLEHGILTETFGGGQGEFGPAVQLVPVSGITGAGLDVLIEGLALQSEIMDLRADPDASAEGIIMDARMDKSLGVVADCIIRWGSMVRGDIVVSGTHIGRIKALKDPADAIIKRGGPSQPVRVIGFKTTPKAGDPLIVVESEEKAQMLVARREALKLIDPDQVEDRPDRDTAEAMEVQIQGVSAQRPRMLAKLFDKHGIDVNAVSKEIRIPVVLKADADGTLAALKESIVSIGTQSKLDIVIDPIVAAIGPLTQADIVTASEAGAAIISFNLKNNDGKMLSLIEEKKIQFKTSNVIYTLINDAKEIFTSYLQPNAVYHVHGKATVQAVFEINNKSDAEKIAGLMVNEGTFYSLKTKHPSGEGTIDCFYRVLRSGEVISPTTESVKCKSLRRVKEMVESIRFGQECGLGLTGFEDFDVGDIIECYSVEMVREVI